MDFNKMKDEMLGQLVIAMGRDSRFEKLLIENHKGNGFSVQMDGQLMGIVNALAVCVCSLVRDEQHMTAEVILDMIKYAVKAMDGEHSPYTTQVVEKGMDKDLKDLMDKLFKKGKE